MNGSRPLEDFPLELGLRFPGPHPRPPSGLTAILTSTPRLGLGFAMDWARLQPNAAGPLETAPLDELRRDWEPAATAGARLVLSLHAGPPPPALIDRGGWSDRDAIGRFADYAAALSKALGDWVGGFILLEDPLACVRSDLLRANPWAPRGEDAFLRATHVVNLALAEATRALHAEHPECAVGRHLRAALCEPFGDGDSDADACERFHRFAHHWFVQPAQSGQYPEAFVSESPAERLDLHDEDDRLLVAPADFLQVEIGPRLRVEAVADSFGLEALPRPVDEGDLTDPELRAESLEGACLQLSEELPDLPLDVTATAPGESASSVWRPFHDAALEGACGARAKGAGVRAYHPAALQPDGEPAAGDALSLRWLVDTLQEGRFET